VPNHISKKPVPRSKKEMEFIEKSKRLLAARFPESKLPSDTTAKPIITKAPKLKKP